MNAKKEDPPILVVSNRLPVTLHRGSRGLETERSVGGLVSALDPLLRSRGGSWVGWPGTRLREDETLDGAEFGYGLQVVGLTDTEVVWCVFRTRSHSAGHSARCNFWRSVCV